MQKLEELEDKSEKFVPPKSSTHHFEDLYYFTFPEFDASQLSPVELLEKLDKEYKTLCASLDEQAVQIEVGEMADQGHRFDLTFTDATFHHILAYYAMRADLDLEFKDGKISLTKPDADKEPFHRMFNMSPRMVREYGKRGVLPRYTMSDSELKSARLRAQQFFQFDPSSEILYLPATQTLSITAPASDLNQFDLAHGEYYAEHELDLTAFGFRVDAGFKGEWKQDYQSLKKQLQELKGSGQLLVAKGYERIPIEQDVKEGEIMSIPFGTEKIRVLRNTNYAMIKFSLDWRLHYTIKLVGLDYNVSGFVMTDHTGIQLPYEAKLRPYEPQVIDLGVKHGFRQGVMLFPALKPLIIESSAIPSPDKKSADFLDADLLPPL